MSAPDTKKNTTVIVMTMRSIPSPRSGSFRGQGTPGEEPAPVFIRNLYARATDAYAPSTGTVVSYIRSFDKPQGCRAHDRGT
jgi:hypothetical protein